MARNIFQYALLGGIQGGAQGLAQGMAEEQRFERERQLMAEREAERRSYLEEQRTRGGRAKPRTARVVRGAQNGPFVGRGGQHSYCDGRRICGFG